MDRRNAPTSVAPSKLRRHGHRHENLAEKRTCSRVPVPRSPIAAWPDWTRPAMLEAMHRRSAALVLGASLVLALVATTGAAAAAPTVAAADFPAKDSRYHSYAEMVHGPPGHPDRPSGHRRRSSRSARATRAATCGPSRSPTTSRPTSRSPRSCSTRSITRASTSRSSRSLALLRWLTDGYGTDTRITNIVDSARDLDHPLGQPRRRRVRPDRRPVPRLAQEPPAERRLDPPGHRPQPQLRLQVGLLRRLIGHQVGRRRTAARRRSPPRRRRRCATSCSAVGSAASSRSRPPSRSTPRASRSCGRTATRRQNVPGDMTVDDHAALAAMGQQDGEAATATRPMQSSGLYITDGDEIDWAYGTPAHLDVHVRALPEPRQGRRPRALLPGRRAHRARDRAQPEAILYLIERAGCRYSIIGKAKTQLRAAVRRLRDGPAGRSTRSAPTPPPAGTWQRGNPQATARQAGTVPVRHRGRS